MNTRAIIIDSAFKLFRNKRFTNITVQDIIDTAHCSRYTFYKYFRDKYELMHLYYTSYVTELLTKEYDGSNFDRIQSDIFHFATDNRAYFSNVKDFEGPDSFWDFLQSYTISFFSAVKQANTKRAILTETEKAEMLFVVTGAVSVFRKYVEDNAFALSPEEVSAFLCNHYPRDYFILTDGEDKGDIIEDFRKIIGKM